MSGGGSSGGTSTTTTRLPGYVIPSAKTYLQQLQNQVLPGGKIAPYPTGINQNVAPFSPDQMAALGLGTSLTPQAQSLADLSSFANSYYASGLANNPQTNPNLLAYANAAMIPYTQNYLQATQPSLLAQAEQSGTVNSSGYNQAIANAQNQYAQGAASLLANIYEPAYQLGTQEQMSAIQGMPAQVAGLYQPTQALYGLGSAQQQQQQNVLNAATQNAMQKANWPFNLLNILGQGLGLAAGGGGNTISTTTPTSGK